MSEATPFSLRIFVVDGDPDGLRVVDRANWNGWRSRVQGRRAAFIHRQSELICIT